MTTSDFKLSHLTRKAFLRIRNTLSMLSASLTLGFIVWLETDI